MLNNEVSFLFIPLSNYLDNLRNRGANTFHAMSFSIYSNYSQNELNELRYGNQLKPITKCSSYSRVTGRTTSKHFIWWGTPARRPTSTLTQTVANELNWLVFG